MIEKNFVGLDSFVWWIGVVEGRQDPLGLGRCQVRFFGLHSDSLTDIPTEDLPWAMPAHSLNSHTFSTPKETDVIFGFFADGGSKQFPIMVGIIPGYQSNPPNIGAGYNDIRNKATIAAAPKPVQSRNYYGDGTGVVLNENTIPESLRYPRSYQVNTSSITGIASNTSIPSNAETVSVVINKKNNRDLKVATATAAGLTWDEPPSPYNPKYPYNQVNETESGHVFEMDDTPNNERISLIHRSGTFVEMHPDGSQVEKITKNNYQIVMSDEFVHIMGNVSVTINSDKSELIGGSCSVQINGNCDIHCGGNANVVSQQDINLTAKKNITLTAGSIGINAPGGVNIVKGSISTDDNLSTGTGASGSFSTPTGQTVHVQNGIVTNITD